MNIRSLARTRPQSARSLHEKLYSCLEALEEWGDLPPNWTNIGDHVVDYCGHDSHLVMAAIRGVIYYFNQRLTIVGWELHDNPTYEQIKDLFKFAAHCSEAGLLRAIHEHYEGGMPTDKADQILEETRKYVQCKHLKIQRGATPRSGSPSKATTSSKPQH